jgi:hypothetical protein
MKQSTNALAAHQRPRNSTVVLVTPSGSLPLYQRWARLWAPWPQVEGEAEAQRPGARWRRELRGGFDRLMPADIEVKGTKKSQHPTSAT